MLGSSLRRGLLVVLLGLPLALPAQAARSELSARAEGLERAQGAMVGVIAEAVEDAGSTATLGPLRVGSGVVIGDDGLVLTIGYLVLEAERVDLIVDGERRVPARVVAYDQATGFGLVQALTPMKVAPALLEALALRKAHAMFAEHAETVCFVEKKERVVSFS